jgi:hypothetical protein
MASADQDREARIRARVSETVARARANAGSPDGPRLDPPPERRNGAGPAHTPRARRAAAAAEEASERLNVEVDPDEVEGPDGLDALPGLARIAASAAWHTGTWALATSARTSRRLAMAPFSGEEAGRLLHDARRALLTVIDATEFGQRVRSGPAGDVARRMADAMGDSDDVGLTARAGNGASAGNSLRGDGEKLLRRSRDVHLEEDAHPAYERILSELAPDEARILRLLLLDGPQPSVDVRTGGPLGMIKSRLLAPGISMIGARAGARYVDRVPSYLNNLFRLGLVWFSRETLREHAKYQVLEAQPEVLDAIHSVSQAKVVRRSIHLTPFGEDFCRVCLTPDEAALGDLPEHSVPFDAKTGHPPNDPAA